jgi:hypothetical protein
MIALLGFVVPAHIAEFPEDAPVLMARLALTIEDALQEHRQSHALWMDISSKSDDSPIEIALDIEPNSGFAAAKPTAGGGGGVGAWPGGGGGGGGEGLTFFGPGGEGAGGAIAVLHFSNQGKVLDIDMFVTPGLFNWVCPHGVDHIKVFAVGGGGGGSPSSSVEDVTHLCNGIRSVG